MRDQSDREEVLWLAANALYLNRANFLILLEEGSAAFRKEYLELDLKDVSNFRRLRDFINFPGLIDDRIEPPSGQTGEFIGRSKRLKELIASDADVARIAFKDVRFKDSEFELLSKAHGAELTNSDRRIPICRWFPGETVWKAREIVLDALRDYEYATPHDAGRKGGPMSRRDIVKERIAKLTLAIVESNSSKRPRKIDAIAAITPHVRSKKAAERVWAGANLTNWKKPGAPKPKKIMSKTEFERAFKAALTNQSPQVF